MLSDIKLYIIHLSFKQNKRIDINIIFVLIYGATLLFSNAFSNSKLYKISMCVNLDILSESRERSIFVTSLTPIICYQVDIYYLKRISYPLYVQRTLKIKDKAQNKLFSYNTFIKRHRRKNEDKQSQTTGYWASQIYMFHLFDAASWWRTPCRSGSQSRHQCRARSI